MDMIAGVLQKWSTITPVCIFAFLSLRFPYEGTYIGWSLHGGLKCSQLFLFHPHLFLQSSLFVCLGPSVIKKMPLRNEPVAQVLVSLCLSGVILLYDEGFNKMFNHLTLPVSTSCLSCFFTFPAERRCHKSWSTAPDHQLTSRMFLFPSGFSLLVASPMPDSDIKMEVRPLRRFTLKCLYATVCEISHLWHTSRRGSHS